MSLLPTLVAVALGALLGIRWGGSIDNALNWRPPLWQALVGAILLTTLIDLVGFSGSVAAFVTILCTAAILAFAIVNLRVGGMVLLVAGVGSNLLVMVLNWGMPVRANALVSAGIVSRPELDQVVLSGGRSISEGASLGFLGDVIPLPWGQVISVGDILILVAACLVTANVMRRYLVGGGHSGYARKGGPQSYRTAMDALGRGPAPRRGPGLHPSRLSDKRRAGDGGRRGAKRPLR